MKTAFLTLLALCLSLNAMAHTSSVVTKTCPLDQTEFEARLDMSGTSFGARLDLKKVGPIAQPWRVAQCPTCHLVILDDEWDADTLATVRDLVESEAYKTAAAKGPSYRCVAILNEKLGAEPLGIAFNYLQASWQVEGSDADAYAELATTCIARLQAAAKALADDTKKRDDYLFATYLQVELHRKLGEFDKALAIIAKFPDTAGSAIEWLPDILAYQKRLCTAKDRANHNIGDQDKKPEEDPDTKAE